MSYSYNDFLKGIFNSFVELCNDNEADLNSIIKDLLNENYSKFLELLKSDDIISETEFQCIIQFYIFNMISFIQNQKNIELEMKNFLFTYWSKIEFKIRKSVVNNKSDKTKLLNKLSNIFSLILKYTTAFFAFVQNLTTASVDRILEQDEAVKKIQSSLNIANENIAELNETVKKFDDIDEKLEETNKTYL